MEIIPLEWPYTVPASDLVFHVTFDGDPQSKARPRFTTNGQCYNSRKTTEYEQALGWMFRSALKSIPVDSKSKFALRCIFYRGDRRRIDCDNLIKAVSDAATGTVWKDDSQVVEVIGRLFNASEKPRVEIVIHRVDNPSPQSPCPVCGKEMQTYNSVKRNHCSMECKRISDQKLRVSQSCKWCNQCYEMLASMAEKRKGFCSRDCSIKFYSYHKTKKRIAAWICQDCGGPVSRKEYIRCRACGMKHRQEPTSNYWQSRYGTNRL